MLFLNWRHANQDNDNQHTQHINIMSHVVTFITVMLGVDIMNNLMLSAIVLSSVMLNFVMLSVIMLCQMLSSITLNLIMLSVVMLHVITLMSFCKVPFF